MMYILYAIVRMEVCLVHEIGVDSSRSFSLAAFVFSSCATEGTLYIVSYFYILHKLHLIRAY